MQCAQINRALGHGLQWRAVKVLQIVERPFVHAVGHQQHFNAFFLEDFQLRAIFGGHGRVGGNKVDGLLAFFHARRVISKAHTDRVGGAGGKTQQFGQTVFVGIVFAQAFFEYGAELAVELAVCAGSCFLLRLVFGAHDIRNTLSRGSGLWQLVVFSEVFQHAQHALGTAFPNRLHVTAFL